jgi:hypothetical protein
MDSDLGLDATEVRSDPSFRPTSKELDATNVLRSDPTVLPTPSEAASDRALALDASDEEEDDDEEEEEGGADTKDPSLISSGPSSDAGSMVRSRQEIATQNTLSVHR